MALLERAYCSRSYCSHTYSLVVVAVFACDNFVLFVIYFSGSLVLSLSLSLTFCGYLALFHYIYRSSCSPCSLPLSLFLAKMQTPCLVPHYWTGSHFLVFFLLMNMTKINLISIRAKSIYRSLCYFFFFTEVRLFARVAAVCCFLLYQLLRSIALCPSHVTLK